MHMGQYALPTPTSTHAWDAAEWADFNSLWHVDSHVATRHRATWRAPHGTSKHAWYELDYFLSDIKPTRGRSRCLHTCALPFGDHFVKTIRLCLFCCYGAARVRHDMHTSAFDGTSLKLTKLRLNDMKRQLQRHRLCVNLMLEKWVNKYANSKIFQAPVKLRGVLLLKL